MLSYPHKEGEKYTEGSIPELSSRQKVFLAILEEKRVLDIAKGLETAEFIGLTQGEFSELFDHCLLTRRHTALAAWGKQYHPNWRLEL